MISTSCRDELIGKREDAEKTAQQTKALEVCGTAGMVGAGLVLPAWLIQNVLLVVVLCVHV